jgi:hypothetical protein
VELAEVIVRSIHNLTTILGSLALVWTLLLALPGVSVVHAEDGGSHAVADEVTEGGSCEAGSVAGGSELVDFLDRAQRARVKQLASGLKAHDPGPEYVDLDNRGFNQPRGE